MTAVLAVLPITLFALVPGPWSNTADPPKKRAMALANKLSLDEKIAFLHGPPTGPCCQCKTAATCAYVGNVAPNTRLGIPPLNMNDGPQGFRDNQHKGSSTAWPSGLTMAASWDVDAMHEWGVGMGKEFFAKGANVQLGPGLCLARIPRNGRNFEYLSGEDPYLGYHLVQPVIGGIQSQTVIANAKHWVLNNQETNRGAVYEIADERTRFELYYPPFQGAIEANVGSVMCSYNKVAGDKWSCENPETLGHDLKESLQFEGFVMSDWGATHSTSIAAGLDVEMPSAKYFNETALKGAIAGGGATEAQITASVVRIFTAMFTVGVMDAPDGTWDWKHMAKNVTTATAAASARKLSAVSTVLLQNDGGVLPLDKTKLESLCVIGYAAQNNTVVHAGGSGSVVPSHISAPLEGIRAAVEGHSVDVRYDDGADASQAAALAKTCASAVVFVQTLSSEGSDRPSLSLNDNCAGGAACKQQDALVSAVSKANPKTIVVMSVPGAVLTPWRKDVAALVTNFMPGQEAGGAIADVLFGAVNPSGKLPLTFPTAENETDITPHQWPGWPDPKKPTYANYSEGLLVGYRWYDAHKKEPAFPFGHGLSYTSFAYAELTVQGLSVNFTVTNTGDIDGAEVAQLYLAFPSAAGEPPKVLRRFAKVNLMPGEHQTVSFTLKDADVSIWDTGVHGWRKVAGEYGVLVGSSSRDVRLQGQMQVKA